MAELTIYRPVKIPNIPDVPTGELPQSVIDLLIAMKQTIEILTGADQNSNTALIDLINTNQ